MSRARELAVLALIVGAFVVSLGRTTAHGYVWDDVPEIERNPVFDRPLVEVLTLTQVERAEPTLADLPGLQFDYDSYRPLVSASYWLDLRLWGRAPGPLHRTSVILGALAIVVAYGVARRWLGGALALVPTALFALHPAQIETVAYLSARGDLLAGLCALLATYAALRALDAPARARAIGWTAAAALAFVASLLSKEAYLALPLAIGAVALARPDSHRRGWIALALVAVALGYLPIRAAMVTTSSGPAYGAAVIGLPAVLLEYVRIVLLPFDLSIERAPRDGYLAVGWALVGVVVVAAGLRARSRQPVAAWARTALAGLAWWIALIGPAAIAVRTTEVVADRYLYAPLFGLGIAAAAAGAQLAAARPRLRIPLVIVAGLWATLLAVVAWRQVPAWHDASTLYRHAAEMAPDSSRAQYRVAFLEIQAGRWDRAVPRLERAVALDPRNVEALNNLGVHYLRTSRPAEAAAALGQAVAVNPARFRSWLNLGLAQLAQGDQASGCASIARALALNPGYAAAQAEQQRRCAAPP